MTTTNAAKSLQAMREEIARGNMTREQAAAMLVRCEEIGRTIATRPYSKANGKLLSEAHHIAGKLSN